MIIRCISVAYSTLGRSLGFSSGGSKENSQNPDTMEAKTVKTPKKYTIHMLMGFAGIACLCPSRLVFNDVKRVRQGYSSSVDTITIFFFFDCVD